MGTGTLEALVGYTAVCAQDSYVLGMVTATKCSIPYNIDALTDALAERSKAVAQGVIP